MRQISLAIADSLWLDGRLEANELFLSRCTAFYGARLYQADLDTDGARRAVNNWVGEVTRGLIPEVLAETRSLRLLSPDRLHNSDGDTGTFFRVKNYRREFFARKPEARTWKVSSSGLSS